MKIFKWFINEDKSIFITDENGSRPFIYNYKTGTRTYPSGRAVPVQDPPSYSLIKGIVDGWNESTYNNAFSTMISLKNSDVDGRLCSFKDGDYYFNIDEEENPLGYEGFSLLEYGVYCNLTMLSSEDSPVVDFNLQKTDKTRQYELDFKIPRAYDGFTYFLTPDSINFLSGNLVYGESEDINIYLYHGSTRLVPNQVNITKSPENLDTYELSENKCYITLKPSKMVYLCPDQRYLDVEVSYNYTEDGEVKTYSATRRLYYQRIDDNDLGRYLTDGDSYSELEMSPAEFSAEVGKLSNMIKTKFNATTRGLKLLVSDLSAQTEISEEQLKSGFYRTITNGLTGSKSSYEETANGARAEIRTKDYSGVIERTADGVKGELRDYLNGTVNSFRETASGYNSEIEDNEDGVKTYVSGTPETFRVYCEDSLSGSTSLYNQTHDAISMECQNAIDGYRAKIDIKANEIRSLVSNTQGQSSVIEQTADSISTEVVDELLNMGTNTYMGSDELVMGTKKKVDDLETEVRNLTINSNGVFFLNEEINLQGVTTINENVTIDNKGNIHAKDVKINGRLKSNCDNINNLFLKTWDENKSGWALWHDYNSDGVTFENGIFVSSALTLNTEANGSYYYKEDFMVVPITNTLDIDCPFMKPSNKYAFMLPVDPEYIGTRIKLNFFNTEDISNISYDSTYGPTIRIYGGRVYSYNLYVLEESNTNSMVIGDFYTTNNKPINPLTVACKCAKGKDAEKIAGLKLTYSDENNNNYETFEAVAIELTKFNGTIELMGVPSNTSAFTATGDYILSPYGFPCVANDGSLLIFPSQGRTAEQVWLTKWVVVNNNFTCEDINYVSDF